jgi:hypothetical protein
MQNCFSHKNNDKSHIKGCLFALNLFVVKLFYKEQPGNGSGKEN